MRRALFVAFVFAVGGSLGWIAGRSGKASQPERNAHTITLDSDIFAFKIEPPTSSKHYFRPFKYSVGSQTFTISDPPADRGDIWVLKLDEGRIIVYCARLPSNE